MYYKNGSKETQMFWRKLAKTLEKREQFSENAYAILGRLTAQHSKILSIIQNSSSLNPSFAKPGIYLSIVVVINMTEYRKKITLYDHDQVMKFFHQYF